MLSQLNMVKGNISSGSSSSIMSTNANVINPSPFQPQLRLLLLLVTRMRRLKLLLVGSNVSLQHPVYPNATSASVLDGFEAARGRRVTGRTRAIGSVPSCPSAM